MHDLELLSHYSQQGDQAAFTTVVSRYVDLVYSTVRRQVRSSELAEEITQAVFLDLARHAGKLRADSHLASWLYIVARRASVDAIRRESRRQKREQTAAEGAAVSSSPCSPWSQVEPLLDEAISALTETDRTAVLLRFFEKKNFSEIGGVLKLTEEAAQKKVRRAIERLRQILSRRGVTASAAVLAAEITPHAIEAAPAGLAASVSTSIALVGPANSAGAMIQSPHTVAAALIAKTGAKLGTIAFMTTAKSTVLVASTVAILALGYSAFEYREAATNRNRASALIRERDRLEDALRQSDHRATIFDHRATLAEQEVADLQRRLSQVLAAGSSRPAAPASASPSDARKLATEKMAQMKPLLEGGMPIKGAAVLFVNGQVVDQTVAFVIGKETRIEGDDGTYIVTPILNPDGSVRYPFQLASKDPNGTPGEAMTRATVIAAPWGAFSFGNMNSGKSLGFVPDMSGP